MPDEEDFFAGLEEKKEEKPEAGVVRVGEKIKQLRESKGLSLKDLSARSGFSTAVLSQLETHMISPPLGTLIKLAHALEVKVGYFLGEGQGAAFSLVRRDERKVVSRYASKEGVNYGYTYEALGQEMKDRHMEPFIVSLEPAAHAAGEHLSAHEGEEFILVLEGEMEVRLGDHKDVLFPGDSIYYHSSLPHLVRCHQEKKTKILAVIFTG